MTYRDCVYSRETGTHPKCYRLKLNNFITRPTQNNTQKPNGEKFLLADSLIYFNHERIIKNVE